MKRTLCLYALVLMLIPVMASAYQIGEQTTPSSYDTGNITQTAEDTTANQGPVRLARFSYVQGNITWRESDADTWTPATVNLPIREGAQVWVTDGGRAEIQFDDGGLLRLGNGSVITLQTLTSDANGEFTEIQMNEGVSTLRLKHANSLYQIDTPLVSIESEGPSNVRIGVDSSVEIAVHSGNSSIHGSAGDLEMTSGDYLDIPNADASYQIDGIPSSDSWDIWNDSRDRQLADLESAGHLPSNIALVAGDLNTYGVWYNDPAYGWVWSPSGVDTDWRPYMQGHWVSVSPFGWTWVADESWGWAPYHYGTWIHARHGWAWVPGPANQYWCPAVVSFSEYNGRIAWVPLAPSEVRYPSALSIGFRNGNWSMFFSIGGAAVYYPQDSHYCMPRAWNNRAVNHFLRGKNVSNIYNNTTLISNRNQNRNVYITNNRFIPINAKGAGATSATVDEFGGRGRYRAEARAADSIFTHGRGIGAPPMGAQPKAGPIAAKRFAPARTETPSVHPDTAVMRRPIYRPTQSPDTEDTALQTQRDDNATIGFKRQKANPLLGRNNSTLPVEHVVGAREDQGQRLRPDVNNTPVGRTPVNPAYINVRPVQSPVSVNNNNRVDSSNPSANRPNGKSDVGLHRDKESTVVDSKPLVSQGREAKQTKESQPDRNRSGGKGNRNRDDSKR